MITKQSNLFKRIRVSYIILYYIILYYIILYYIIKIVCLLHVLVIPVAIIRDVHYEGYITQLHEPMHKWF